ncbi:MAG: lycopene cyclase family protein [Flavihumibacter sp.]
MCSDHLYQYKPYHYSYEYDYVFTGAGLAGLSLIMRMLKSGYFDNNSFLLVDRDWGRKENRNWCFRERSAGFFEELVCRRWNNGWFHAPGFSKQFDLEPYQYKLIRSRDFYRYCFDYMKTRENVRLLQEPVASLFNRKYTAGLVLDNGTKYHATTRLFNSINTEPDRQGPAPFCWQYFEGRVIETPGEVFDPGACTLMDFRMQPAAGSGFVYTMPLNPKQALLTAMVFPANTLAAEPACTRYLESYIEQVLNIAQYQVLEIEKGRMPLGVSRPGPELLSQGSFTDVQINIGGGGSFSFAQQYSEGWLASLQHRQRPALLPRKPRRFYFYDRMMLQLLHRQSVSVAEGYRQLFAANPIDRLFRFWDHQSGYLEEMQLFSGLPGLPFLKASISATFA